MTEKMHNAWDLRCPGKQYVYYSLIIWTKKNVSPRPLRAPYMRSHHHRKQFLVSHGLVSLWPYPGTTEPFIIVICPKAQGACCIQRHFHVCRSGHPWEQPKAYSMPWCQKIMPPLQIQPKFRAQANRMIASAEAAEKIQHTPQKSVTRPNYLGSMVKMAN